MFETFYQRWFTSTPISECVFGESFAGREIIEDPMNRDLFMRMLKNYVAQHQSLGYKFHPEMQKDVSRIGFYEKLRYVGAVAGITFAGTVWNPNYCKRNSFYARKFSIVLWGIFGYNLANRYYQDQVTLTMLRMNDYFPMEIKRALRDKDFRHFALFDIEQAAKERQLFDAETGKSLS